MHLKTKKAFGKLKPGAYLETATEEQGKTLIDKGYAEEVKKDEFTKNKGQKADKPKPVPASTTTTKAVQKPVAKTEEEE